MRSPLVSILYLAKAGGNGGSRTKNIIITIKHSETSHKNTRKAEKDLIKQQNMIKYLIWFPN